MRFINITIIDRFYQQWIYFHFKRHFRLFRRASWISAVFLINRILLARWKCIKKFKYRFHVGVWSLRVCIVCVWKSWTRLTDQFSRLSPFVLFFGNFRSHIGSWGVSTRARFANHRVCRCFCVLSPFKWVLWGLLLFCTWACLNN